MSKTFSLNSIIPSLTSTVKGDAPARTIRKKFNVGNWVAPVSVLSVFALVAALGFYVYMINAYASKGYELKQQQAAMQEVTETNKRLVIQQAALGSIVKVNDVAATSGMVPVTGEEFLVANQLSSR